jgi:hypothetical protein
MQQLEATMEELCFLYGPCRDVISKDESQLIVSSALEAVKRGSDGLKLKNLLC